MLRAFMSIAALAILLALPSCDSPKLSDSGRRPAIELVGHGMVDGKPVEGHWLIPGTPYAEFTNPIYDTVSLKLDSGETLWIAAQPFFNPLYLPNKPGAQVTVMSTSFAFFDNIENPQIITDYALTFQPQFPNFCPRGFRIKGCEISLTATRLPDSVEATVSPGVVFGQGSHFGRPDGLAEARKAAESPLFFVSCRANWFSIPDFRSDPFLAAKLKDIHTTTVVMFDLKETDRLLEAAQKHGQTQWEFTDLHYEGGTTWSIPEVPGKRYLQDGRQLYRTTLQPADFNCCTGPYEPVVALNKIVGRLFWRAKTVEFSPSSAKIGDPKYLALFQNPVLVDPDSGEFILIRIPEAKRVWPR
jgi:hypothetical protein